MNAFDPIHTRRSIRRYTDQPVPPDLIDRLLEAATWAPSSHNRQPWRFAVVTTSSVKARLADRMGERLKADRSRAADRVQQIDRDMARSRERITSAPVAIIVCLSITNDDQHERLMAIQSAAASIQNLLLAAHEIGLGACWMAAPLFCPDVVREVLHLPDDWEAQALITIGYPANAGKPRDRVDFREITIWK
jgi:coenzyme F420-0:L-glutamate ligase / coenzyme F420-1:gamma-L-glutamate ligase